MATQRNNVVDILRFVAVTWVVLFHLNETVPYQNNWYRLLVKHGHLGVPIFFVISGYCIALSVNHKSNVKEFISRRFFRIFPTYWFSLLIVMLAVLSSLTLIGTNSVAKLPKTIVEISATITLLTSPFSKVSTINWVYWSLTVEIFFYAIIAIYLFINQKFRFSLLLLVTILPFFFKDQDHGLLFFVKYWPSFMLGFSFYFLLIQQNSKNIFLTVLSLITLIFFSNEANNYIFTCVFTVGIISLGHINPINKNSFSNMGNYSYAIYLIHVPIGVNILGAVKQFSFVQHNIWANILWDLICYALVILIARIIYLKLELPLIKYGKRKFEPQKLKPI